MVKQVNDYMYFTVRAAFMRIKLMMMMMMMNRPTYLSLYVLQAMRW